MEFTTPMDAITFNIDAPLANLGEAPCEHLDLANGAMEPGNNPGGTRTMKAAECKAKCLQLMDEVADAGTEIVITKHGKPVSRLVPYRDPPKSLLGAGRGRMKTVGDIIGPVDVEWQAEANPDRVLNP